MDNEIRLLNDRLVEAWNRGDMDAYGKEFTEDASYTTFMGSVYRGRAELVRGHKPLLAGMLKGTRMYSEIVEIRFYGPDLAVVLTRGDVAKKAPRRLPKVQTFTVVREADGQWRVAAFQNTKRARLMEALTYRLVPASRPGRMSG